MITRDKPGNRFKAGSLIHMHDCPNGQKFMLYTTPTASRTEGFILSNSDLFVVVDTPQEILNPRRYDPGAGEYTQPPWPWYRVLHMKTSKRVYLSEKEMLRFVQQPV